MGTFASKKRRGNSPAGMYMKGEYENDPVSLLAAQVVIYAIADWRELVRKKAWRLDHLSKNCNFAELRRFFKSDWCAFVMQGFDIEPARVLEVLERELQEAMQRG